ncbi:uncharacterized protein N7443_000841 [Penicillium atrosanguineum]|uniref:uncharacterized protein n=1 Tax=Penicillium atrosanguineum TaxID=1132637 RepID=UPI00239E6FE9|nr:uncharacterized protein N7443_000841 [Penicillium atrosanguineum]KAJ5313957.1 hypothetical protein N7443_000841 [Penicillium atrosanguineum]
MTIQHEIRQTVSPLDFVPPLNYVRLVFPLPLKSNVDDKIVFNDLHHALHKTFVQEPWVSGKAFRQSPNTPGWRPGQIEMRYRQYSLHDPLPYQLRYLKLETDWTYDDFKAAGFPSGVFPEELLLLDAPRLGDVDVAGADIFLAQANFLSGGVLLALTVSHSTMDAGAMIGLMKLWAENFRELRGRDEGGRVAPTPYTSIDRDHNQPDRIWEKETAQRILKNSPDDPWLRALVCLDLGQDNDGPTGCEEGQKAAIEEETQTNERVMLNRVVFLSGPDLAALQKECAAESVLPGTPPLSISDAIQALLWRVLMKARVSAAEARSKPLRDDISVFETPVDVRSTFGQGFPPAYLGNCFLMNTARMPLSELLDPSTSLGRIAQAIRQGAARLDGDAVQDAYGLLRATGDLSRVQGRFVERPDSSDVLVSNIIFLPLEEINFGDQYFSNGGTPQALRVLHGQYAARVRLAHVLPRNKKHGGIEVSVNLFEDEFEYLDRDGQFNRYLVSIEPCRLARADCV